jgi:4-carboxymuconolactone decarboxylase
MACTAGRPTYFASRGPPVRCRRRLKVVHGAALNVGVQLIEIREAIYQLAPFIGFPCTLNAMATVNDVFRARGIQLPLPVQGTVSDADRYPKGLAAQAPFYGNEIEDNLAGLPQPFNELLPRYLTEFCFGDFYTRGGLTLFQRELLVSEAQRFEGVTRPARR